MNATQRFPTIGALLTLALLLSFPTASAAMMSQPDAGTAALALASVTVAKTVDVPAIELAAAADIAADGTAPAADTATAATPTPVFCYVVVDHVAHYAGVMHFPSRSAALALADADPLPAVLVATIPDSAAGDVSGALKTTDNAAAPAGDLCCFIVPNDSVCLLVMVNRSELGSGQLIAARWYDPRTGRFISRDPVAGATADLAYNPYSYCRNNPLKYVDPTGALIDFALDAAFVVNDLVDIYCDPSDKSNYAALAGDLTCAVIPMATGGGKMARAAYRALNRADDAIRVEERMRRAARMARVGRRAGQALRVTNGVITRYQALSATAQSFNTLQTNPQSASNWASFGLSMASLALPHMKWKIPNVILSDARIARLRERFGRAGREAAEVEVRATNRGAQYSTWNEFQAGTKGRFQSRAEAGAEWQRYRAENGIYSLRGVEASRRAGVRAAWNAEADLIRRTGEGSRNWSDAQIDDILTTGRVRGYEGHHIFNVTKYPHLAADPRNVRFGTRREHFEWHDNDWRRETTGELIER